MPKLIQEERVGELVVRYRQRLPGESFLTKFAIQVFDEDQVVHVFNCEGFSNDRSYMDRKWHSVVQAAREAQGI